MIHVKEVGLRENVPSTPEKEPGKIKRWFVARLEHLFGIDRIKTRLDAYEVAMKVALGNAVRYEEECKSKIERYERIAALLDNAKVGADVAIGRDRSWAVVCLAGKKDAVYFYQFPSNGYRRDQTFSSTF